MLRLMFFLIGFGLSIIGFVYIIAYLNYITIGYTWENYLEIVTRKPECFIGLIGVLILVITIFTRRDESDLRI